MEDETVQWHSFLCAYCESHHLYSSWKKGYEFVNGKKRIWFSSLDNFLADSVAWHSVVTSAAQVHPLRGKSYHSFTHLDSDNKIMNDILIQHNLSFYRIGD